MQINVLFAYLFIFFQGGGVRAPSCVPRLRTAQSSTATTGNISLKPYAPEGVTRIDDGEVKNYMYRTHHSHIVISKVYSLNYDINRLGRH